MIGDCPLLFGVEDEGLLLQTSDDTLDGGFEMC